MENFEEILRKDLHQFLLSMKEVDERYAPMSKKNGKVSPRHTSPMASGSSRTTRRHPSAG